MNLQDLIDQLTESEAEMLETLDRGDVRQVISVWLSVFYDIETITVEGNEVVINIGEAL